MDNDELVRRAMAQADQAKRDFDNWEYRRQRRMQQRRDLANDDEQRRVRDWLTRSAPPEQRNDIPRVGERIRFHYHVQKPAEPDHDAWNAWAKAIARREAVELDNANVDDIRAFQDSLEDALAERKEFFLKQIADLRNQIDQLRAMIGEGTAQVRNFAPLIPLKGGRRVA